MRPIALLLAAVTSLGIAGARADTPYYQGKQIKILVGFTPGGGTDLFGRIFTERLGRTIPGNPSVIVQNMPGAGSVTCAELLRQRRPARRQHDTRWHRQSAAADAAEGRRHQGQRRRSRAAGRGAHGARHLCGVGDGAQVRQGYSEAPTAAVHGDHRPDLDADAEASACIDAHAGESGCRLPRQERDEAGVRARRDDRR